MTSNHRVISHRIYPIWKPSETAELKFSRTLATLILVAVFFSSLHSVRATTTERMQAIDFYFRVQDTPGGGITLKLQGKDNHSFDTLFEEVSIQSKEAFVAEGSPLKTCLSEEDVKELTALEDQTNLHADDVVQCLAGLYDYDADFSREQSDHIVLLRKRYSDPADIPFVTFDEGVRDLTRLADALDSLCPEVKEDSTHYFHLLAKSLTEDQIKGLKEGLPMTQLSPAQKQFAQDFAIRSYLTDNPQALRNTILYARDFDAPTSVFHWMPLLDSGVQVFGYEGVFHRNNISTKGQVPLSHGLIPQLPGIISSIQVPQTHTVLVLGSLRELPKDPTIISQVHADIDNLMKDGKMPDPDAPTAKEYEPRAAPSAELMTLAIAVEKVHVEDKTKVWLDDALTQKPVTLIGSENTTARPLLQALCDAYGLHLRHPADGEFAIGLPEYSGDLGFTDRQSLIHCYIPTPWQRAQLGIAAAASGVRLSRLENFYRSKYGQTTLPDNVKDMERGGAATSLETSALWRKSAIHRLRVIMEPRVEASPTKTVPMAEMGEEAKRDLLFLCVLDELRGFVGMEQTAGDCVYLAHLSDCFLYGNFSAENDYVVMRICARDANGKPIIKAGGGSSLRSIRMDDSATPTN